MKFDPRVHHRRSIRLQGYDYAQAGFYFVTLCIQGRETLLGEVGEGKSLLSTFGGIVAECWAEIPEHFPRADIDASVVMPNHVHGILILTDPNGVGGVDHGAAGAGGAGAGGAGAGTAPLRGWGARRPRLGQVVAFFKYQSTKRINQLRGTPGMRVWQRNYYEHIIRAPADLDRIREYIANNPLSWELDQLHPRNPSKW